MINFFFSYIKWHYSRAYFEIFRISGDFIGFLFNFFSIPILFKTLFVPWQMLEEPYKKGLDAGEVFGTFALNLMMRFVGFFVRTLTIIFGFFCIFLSIILSFTILFIWTIFPLLLIIFLISGLRFLTN